MQTKCNEEKTKTKWNKVQWSLQKRHQWETLRLFVHKDGEKHDHWSALKISWTLVAEVRDVISPLQPWLNPSVSATKHEMQAGQFVATRWTVVMRETGVLYSSVTFNWLSSSRLVCGKKVQHFFMSLAQQIQQNLLLLGRKASGKKMEKKRTWTNLSQPYKNNKKYFSIQFSQNWKSSPVCKRHSEQNIHAVKNLFRMRDCYLLYGKIRNREKWTDIGFRRKILPKRRFTFRECDLWWRPIHLICAWKKTLVWFSMAFKQLFTEHLIKLSTRFGGGCKASLACFLLCFL